MTTVGLCSLPAQTYESECSYSSEDMEQFQMELKQLQNQMRQLKVSGYTTSLFINIMTFQNITMAQNVMKLNMKIMIQPLHSAMSFSVLNDEYRRGLM